jgi:sulfhydrogenase subunit beta (sulfur reductase)
MDAKMLPRADVSGFLGELRGKGYEIWGPVEVDGAVDTMPLDGTASPVTEYWNSRVSPKAMVFPQSERMFVFSVDRSRPDAFILKEVEEPCIGRLAFAIRPCDARAFGILDKVFLVQGAWQDPYYARKRESMVVMALGCNSPCTSCFCHWTGGGPFSREGVDIMMTDLGEGFLLEPVTDKGRELLQGIDLPGASPSNLEEAKGLQDAATAAMGEPLDPSHIRKRPLLEMFGDSYWERAHEACIKCGTCTYLCPTCSCFDIQDEVRGPCGVRGRNWDTCMFPLTTLHASGHNPRPTGKERFRQRFMHKLRYFLDDFGTIMCVGCGRCVQFCPVNIDIREIIRELRG